MQIRSLPGPLAALAVLALLAYAFWVEPNWVDVRLYKISGSESPHRIRIAQLSDLHLRNMGRREAAIAGRLQEIQPDLIVLSGDVLDSDTALPELESFLHQIGAAETVAVLGNWEYWGDVNLETLRQTYARRPRTQFLINGMASYVIKGRILRVTGLDDFTAGQPHLGTVSESHEPATSVMIQHSPGWFSSPATKWGGKRFDLCLSGHTHGGQITLFGLIVWTPRGSGSYTNGFYETSGCPLYVSKGLGTSVLALRFGARPEIAVFDL